MNTAEQILWALSQFKNALSQIMGLRGTVRNRTASWSALPAGSERQSSRNDKKNDTYHFMFERKYIAGWRRV